MENLAKPYFPLHFQETYISFTAYICDFYEFGNEFNESTSKFTKNLAITETNLYTVVSGKLHFFFFYIDMLNIYCALKFVL